MLLKKREVNEIRHTKFFTESTLSENGLIQKENKIQRTSLQNSLC